MDSVTLTPHGTLIFPERPGDWPEVFFDLAAKKETEGDPSVRFWRQAGENMVSGLCRLPEKETARNLSPPPDSVLAAWIDTAPPMDGGEYLSADRILEVWGKVIEWVADRTSGAEDLPQFLARRAPKWQRVGRVAFHLAENKIDPQKPFAFLATYITGLSASGRDRHQPLNLALKQYAGSRNRPALVNLLTPVRKASDCLKWVRDMVSDSTVYQPASLTINQAYHFLKDVPVLEDCGLMVRIPDWWKRKPKVSVRLEIGGRKKSLFGAGELIDWDVRLSVGEENLTEAEIRELLSSEEGLIFFKGQWVEADREKLQQALDHWQEIKKSMGSADLSFADAMRLLAGYPASFDKSPLEVLESGPWVQAQAGPAMEELLSQLRDPKAGEVPRELKAVLRPYQEKGLAWLALLSGLGLGACLADDMGLGKTVQVLALLLLDRRRVPEPQCSLLAAPASLLGNWKLEAQKFAPDLRLSIFHPSETPKDKLNYWEKHPEILQKESDLVVTSYALLNRNLDFFSALSWRMMIIDEAQAIKNSNTGQSRAVRKIKAQARLALTGTPIENRLTDIWSLFDFLNPGLLGSAKKFLSAVKAMEERKSDQYGPLRRLTAPYLLRRLKTDKNIISDLPDKTETTVQCGLSQAQAKLYSQIVSLLQDSLMEFSGEESDKFRRQGLVLQTLMRLKQLCNHPAQLTGDSDWTPERSGKFMRIAELVREMAERQEKLLVFTQFQEIIEPLGLYLAQIYGRSGLALHGGTPVRQRQGLVAEFQKDEGPPFFILSLKAGGTGLNLTSAGQVIHFDRWWNPAVEDQATDRAYRIGQKKNVLVHKCVTRGTLEERIDAMLHDKRHLAGEVLSRSGEVNLTSLDDKALLDLISLDLERAAV
ncbi:MAG: DEAD/DEAH box helicase [Deltaproteobacteria bacterium]|jgi:non-specific serine/threonine protein kinase|nr:DEAD/DEAH box helicase [Deltaproteobacteria bacterium]